MKIARIRTVLPVVVASLVSIALLSHARYARATPGESAVEKDRVTVGLTQGDPKKVSTDLESLQGTWNIDTMGWGAKGLPKELMKGYTFVFAGNKLTWNAAMGMMSKGGKVSALDGAFLCDFTIDPGKMPRQIDITYHPTKGGDRTMLGIYEIKENSLKIYYYTSQTSKRPTEFSTSDDRNLGYLTFTRAKAGGGPAIAPKEVPGRDPLFPLPPQEVPAGKFEQWAREAAKQPTYTRVEYDGKAYWVVVASFGYGDPAEKIAVYAPTKDGSHQRCMLVGPIRVGRLAIALDEKTGLLTLRRESNSSRQGELVLSCNLKAVGVLP